MDAKGAKAMTKNEDGSYVASEAGDRLTSLNLRLKYRKKSHEEAREVTKRAAKPRIDYR